MEQPIEEPGQPEQPLKPERPKRRDDPDGQAWHSEARVRWDRAAELEPEATLEAYDPPPLPAWSAPAHVRRQLFGRYVADRDTAIVHDIRHAIETCEVDAIRNATFYHFELELPADVVDCACMEA